MKKLLTLSLITLIVVSCSEKAKTAEEIAKENIEQYFLKSAHDPDSYEFVDMAKIDTIYLSEHLEAMVAVYQSQVDAMSNYPNQISEHLKTAKEFRKYGSKYEPDALKSEEMANNLQNLMDEATKKLSDLKSRLEATPKDSIMELKTSFSCRANNKMGAKILNTYQVFLTDKLAVKTMESQ